MLVDSGRRRTAQYVRRGKIRYFGLRTVLPQATHYWLPCRWTPCSCIHAVQKRASTVLTIIEKRSIVLPWYRKRALTLSRLAFKSLHLEVDSTLPYFKFCELLQCQAFTIPLTSTARMVDDEHVESDPPLNVIKTVAPKLERLPKGGHS